jgi:peroxiredoxin (alkyl hydroperoxide reductase subunit C)
MCLTTLVTKPAPDFTADAVMPDNSFAQVTLSSFKGKYVVLFFYPLDFTFVCPSEILAFNKKLADFKAKNCEVLGVSVDSKFTHLAWKNTKVEDGGIGNIQYPLVSDIKKEIAAKYGVLFEAAGVAFRGLFLIDTKGNVRHALINDLPLGRNVDEALRMVDALQFVETHGEVCPANWKQGEEAMKPTAEGVASYLAKHSK